MFKSFKTEISDMLHNGMLLSADMALQQHHNNNCFNVDISTELGSMMMMPRFHGFCDNNNLATPQVLDLQDHNPPDDDDDTFLGGARDLPTFGHLSLAAKVASQAAAAGNTTSTRTTTLENCFSEDSVFIENTETNTSKEEKRIEIGEKLESKLKKRTRTRAVTSSSDNSKASPVHKPNYIHVKARRGQATDSHSLAERARREKISKKMKFLQDLVPGCSKIIGKAGVLDEIINYVQSLQTQVEFLSMKLATQNPRLGFNIDNFSAHQVPACAASFPAAHASSALANLAELQINPGQHVVVTTNYELERPMYAPQNAVDTTTSSSVSIPELYLPTWDSDLLSLEDGVVLDQE